MELPLTTGRVARLLETIEPKLAEAVRRGHVRPEPPIIAGRRLWYRAHIEQVAEHLGLLTADLRARLAAAEEVRAWAGDRDQAPTGPAAP